MKSRLLKNCNLPFFCFRIKLQDLLPSGFAIDVNHDKSKMAKKGKRSSEKFVFNKFQEKLKTKFR